MGFEAFLGLVQEPSSVNSLAGPLVNLGAIGVCLVGLAIYYIQKDKKYEKRIDEMRLMEAAFRKEQADLQERFRSEQAAMAEKYRTAMEKFAQTLDLLVVLTRDSKTGGK